MRQFWGLFVATNLPDALSLIGICVLHSNIVPSWINLGMLKAFYIPTFQHDEICSLPNAENVFLERVRGLTFQ